MKYGHKSLKEYDQQPGQWDKMGIGMLVTKIEFVEQEAMNHTKENIGEYANDSTVFNIVRNSFRCGWLLASRTAAGAVPEVTLTAEEMDEEIERHIAKMWGGLEIAAVEYFVKTGTINGSFKLRLIALLKFSGWRLNAKRAVSYPPVQAANVGFSWVNLPQFPTKTDMYIVESTKGVVNKIKYTVDGDNSMWEFYGIRRWLNESQTFDNDAADIFRQVRSFIYNWLTEARDVQPKEAKEICADVENLISNWPPVQAASSPEGSIRYAAIAEIMKVIDAWLKSDDTFVTDGNGGDRIPGAWVDCVKGSLMMRLVQLVNLFDAPAGQSAGVWVKADNPPANSENVYAENDKGKRCTAFYAHKHSHEFEDFDGDTEIGEDHNGSLYLIPGWYEEVEQRSGQYDVVYFKRNIVRWLDTSGAEQGGEAVESAIIAKALLDEDSGVYSYDYVKSVAAKFAEWTAKNLWTTSWGMWYEYQNEDNPITFEKLFKLYTDSLN